MTELENHPLLVGLDRPALAHALGKIGVPKTALRMRVSQLWHWFYLRGVTRFGDMTTISKELRRELDHHFSLERPKIISEQISTDGTRKWLLQFPPQQPGDKEGEVETVYIPEKNRGTLCISSQIGCTLTCPFCHTGTQRLVRNLEAGEIVSQIMVARDQLKDWPLPKAAGESRKEDEDSGGNTEGPRKITNIVLMGMGEPLYNFDNVKQAIDILSDGEGLSVSRRRITLSTSGIVPMIERCGLEAGVMLAISLHAVRDPLRDRLVPINRKYPLAELLEACRTYPGLSNARRITFEYVMLKDINDKDRDAKELVRLLANIPAKINLIPFNPWPGSPYQCSDWERIEAFAEIVNRAGYASPVRTPRGRDIMAACGQLKSQSVKLSARERQSSVSQEVSL